MWQENRICRVRNLVGKAPLHLGYDFTRACPMYRIELAPGDESIFRTIEELATGIRSGLITDRARIHHKRTGLWVPITSHPHYKLALEGPVASPAPVAAAPAPAPSAPTASAPRFSKEASEPESSEPELLDEPVFLDLNAPKAPSSLALAPRVSASAEISADAVDDAPADHPVSVAANVGWTPRMRRTAMMAASMAVLLGGMFVSRPLWESKEAAAATTRPDSLSAYATYNAANVRPTGFPLPDPSSSARAAGAAAPEVLVAAARPDSAKSEIVSAPVAPSFAAPALKDVDAAASGASKSGYANSYAAARDEFEAGFRTAGVTSLFAPSHLGTESGIHTARLGVAAASTLVRQYHRKEEAIEQNHRDSIRGASQRMPADVARSAVEVLQAADSLLGVLEEQLGRYQVRQGVIHFQDAEAADAYLMARGRLVQLLEESRGADVPTLARVVNAVGSPRPPEGRAD
jgi:hypothetical protein